MVGVKSVPWADLISASIDGDLKHWDFRAPTAANVIEKLKATITALDCHSEADLFAVATTDPCVRLYHHDRPITTIRHREGFLGQRIPTVNGLTFHPRRMMMALMGVDGSALLYTP